MRSDAVIRRGIRRLLTETGWTYEELAQRSGVHRHQISKIVRGISSPTIRTLQAIADAFGVTVGELYAAGEKPLLEKEVSHVPR